ncbi:unnamed protein product, partial [Brachionus calyciflorus]
MCKHLIAPCLKHNIGKKHYVKVHIIILDASKAFDKLWRQGLFFKLINVIDESIRRILFKYYSISKAYILLNNIKSEEFIISQGVKQGGILSPFLFNFYVNDLIKDCTDCDLGAKIYELNLSIIAYCDDNIVLSPITSDAQFILDIINCYSREWMIEFNSTKSAYMSFSKDKFFQKYNFKLGEVTITKKEGIIYLGDHNFVNNYLNEKMRNVEKTMFSLYPLGCKPKHMKPSTIVYLYKQFCQSIFRYHLDIVLINMTKLKELDTRQNILIKRSIVLNKFTRR